jgi:Xaa-Pro aminopeptidase
VTRESHAAFAARKAAEQSCATDATTQEAAENKASSPLKLAIEDSITLAEYRRLEKEFSASSSAPVMLEETTDLVLSLRAVKSTQEIVALKRAQAITDAAFAHIIRFMKPGMTEREVQLELEGFMLRAGAEGLAFPSIVAAGPNGASPHAIPGSTRLVAGQCVVLDFGARACGYCSDMTRVVFLGEPDQTLQKAWEVLRRANEEVETFLKPGVTGRAAHELAERILAEGGFEGHMGHGLGHGVGIEIHELPVLSPRNEKPLEVGNVVTVEPGIYIPGAFGMRLEDFGVITEGGFEVFTQSTHEMVVI